LFDLSSRIPMAKLAHQIGLENIKSAFFLIFQVIFLFICDLIFWINLDSNLSLITVKSPFVTVRFINS